MWTSPTAAEDVVIFLVPDRASLIELFDGVLQVRPHELVDLINRTTGL
jgi:hypothetical protein